MDQTQVLDVVKEQFIDFDNRAQTVYCGYHRNGKKKEFSCENPPRWLKIRIQAALIYKLIHIRAMGDRLIDRRANHTCAKIPRVVNASKIVATTPSELINRIETEQKT